MQRFIDWIRLIRLVNCLLASVGVWVGAYLTWTVPEYYGPTVVSLAAFLACAAGNVLNDLVDIRVDAVNRPDRILVVGRISPRAARYAAVVLNLAAVVCGIAVSWPVLLLGLVTVAVLTAYNLWLKRLPLIGNAAVAASAGLTFVAGGLAVDPITAFHLPGPLIGAAFAFLFHLVREVVKDVQDMNGDKRAGLSSLPLVWGVSRSMAVAFGVFVLLVVLSSVPVWQGWFGRTYLIITVYIVELPLLGLLALTWRFPGARMLSVASAALKIGMALGLVALLLG